MASLKETVAERIAGLGPEVQTGVADVLVEQVKKKRIDAVLTALNLKDEKEKKLEENQTRADLQRGTALSRQKRSRRLTTTTAKS